MNEGWQGTKQFMPAMPNGDVWNSIREVLIFEKAIRFGSQINLHSSSLDEYWIDIIRLLQIHTLLKNNDIRAVVTMLHEIKNEIYISYVKDKIRNNDGRCKR